MPSNAEAAALLREIADLLDLNGERFKPEAYRRAARSLETLSEELAVVAARGGLREVPGVGDAIEEKLREYLASGRIGYLDRLRTQIPGGLLEMMRLPGVGPKTTRRFWVELGVTDRAELAGAIEAGRLEGLKGFGPRKIDQVRSALTTAAAGPAPGRVPIDVVYATAVGLRDALRAHAPVDRVEIAGSFRRCRETVGDLDLLVTSTDPEKVFDVFSANPAIAEVRMRGGTKETVVLRGGLQVDLRVVEPDAFGAALQYFTGSKEHNVRLRSLARDRGLKINEYGVFRGDERVGGRTEEELYALLGLAWIPPELREDHGEIDQAASGQLPRLVEAADLRGDLHVHLPKGDPEAGLRAVCARAEALRLDYLGIVVAEPDGSAGQLRTVDALSAAMTAAKGGAVRLLPVAEILPETPTSEVKRVGAELLVLRPGAGTPAAPADLPAPAALRLVAHVGGEAVAAHRWLDVAARSRIAIETGPGAERVDSSLARAAAAMEVRLAVPTGVGEAEGEATRAIALGFARRAGASRESIANARPFEGVRAGAVRRPRRPTAG
ncbi:MAG TPA: helix-hairpin-helix domain-containing protein [Thermoplasmata archaeon]|nr:helix-hairpin-helix domain-containing protein [Thermoplasmata archaeon]